MPSLPDPVKKGANVAASVLETTAGVLRHVAGDDDGDQKPAPESKPEASAAPEPQQASKQTEDKREPAAAQGETDAAPKARGTKPAAATRTRIANPKAAKKVRARQG